jgi:hypothetical protein
MSESAIRVRNYNDRDRSRVCYWKHEPSGEWYIWWPRGDGTLGGLANHKVDEHEDVTISVTPSILTKGSDDNGNPVEIHGYLTKGVWHEC